MMTEVIPVIPSDGETARQTEVQTARQTEVHVLSLSGLKSMGMGDANATT